MAEEQVKITFEIDGIQQSVSSVDELQAALKGVDTQAQKTEESLEDAADAAKDLGKESESAGKSGGAGLKLIDEATGGLGTKFKDVAGAFKTLGTSMVASFKSGVAGASALKKGLIATGIGAIVVALGIIVAYWDDIIGAISGVTAEEKKLMEFTEAEVQARQEGLDAILASENSLRLQGKSEREIRQMKIDQTNEIIDQMSIQLEQQKQQKQAQIEASQRNKDIAQGIITFLSLPLTAILFTVDQIMAGLSKVPGLGIEATTLAADMTAGIAGLIFDPEEVAEKGDATIAETEKQLAKLQNTRDGYLLAGIAEDQKAADARKAIKDTEAAEEEARLAKLTADELAALDKITEKYKEKQQLTLDQQKQNALAELELLKASEQQKADIKLAINKHYDELIEAERLKKEEEDAAQALIVSEMLEQARISEIEDLYLRAQAELEIQRQADIERITLAGATAEQIATINKKYDKQSEKLGEEKLKFDKALKDQEVQNALNAGSQVLGSIVSLVGEGSAIGKAAAIAQTTIDTYSSATGAYSSVVGIPIVGPVLAPIAAGIAVAAGMASIKKIVSTKIPTGGKGRSAGGGGSISAPSVPSFDPTRTLEDANRGQDRDNTITLGEQQGSSNGNIIKAYVVSDEMTSQQEKDKRINDLARL